MNHQDLVRLVAANEKLESDERLTAKELAAKTNKSPRQIRRIKQGLREGKYDQFFGIPNQFITSRGMSYRTEDGWEKITYKPGAKEFADALSYEDVEKTIRKWKPTLDFSQSPKNTGTLVVSAADFQTGKVSERGGTDELIAKVLSVYDEVQSRGYFKTIIFADLGDIIENFTNVKQQAQTNDLSLTDQIRVAQRLLLEGVLRFSQQCDELIYAAVPSNHGSVRTGIGAANRANAPDDDYGLLIQENIAMAAKLNPELNNVSFIKPKKWEEAVTVVLEDGTGVGFTHGDLAGSMAKVPDWFARLSHGHRSGLHEADILVHGHFHTLNIQFSGDCRMVIGTPSLDPGSPWYTNKTGEQSPSCLLTFVVENHKARDWQLHYPKEG